MPGDGVQNFIPINLYRGVPTATPHTVTLTSAYDYLITRVFALNFGSSSAVTVDAEATTDYAFWEASLGADSSATRSAASGPIEVVLPAGQNIILVGSANNISWSVDGYLIVPGNATLL